MKKRILTLFALIMLANLGAFAQIEFYGEQTRGTDKNAELTCKALIITEQVEITKIEGDNAGFWIENKSATVQSFFKDEGEFFPEAIGYILEPGKYWIYPNLKDEQKKATIKITLTKTNR